MSLLSTVCPLSILKIFQNFSIFPMSLPFLYRSRCLLMAGVVFGSEACARVSVPSIFSDHMVIQAGMDAPVWGKADPNEGITVTLGTQTKTTKADALGQWKVKFEKLIPGSVGSLTIKGNTTLVIEDVAVGEVWLCAGQSNMKMTISQIKAAEEIAPLSDPSGLTRMCWGGSRWGVIKGENLGNAAATAYLFGRELRRTLDMPVGLIVAAGNGSMIEAWTDLELQRSQKELQPMVENWLAKQAEYNLEAEKVILEKKLGEHRMAVDLAKSQGKPIPRPPLLTVPPNKTNGFPGYLFNMQINPVIPFAIRGAIWYQGESNTATQSSGRLYERQLKLLISDWRSRWGQGDFPFVWVQLPNFEGTKSKLGLAWPEVRESMLNCLSLPHTGMAVTIDIGEAHNLHPINKQEVARRLSILALAKAYKKDIPCSGPLLDGHEIKDGQVICKFKFTEGGLKTRDGGELKGFMLAGNNHQWVKASAKIAGNHVVVSSHEITEPVAVRYAWADNPECNLVNGASLPASPFRTDQW